MTRATKFDNIHNQSFSISTSGHQSVQLDKKLIFDPTLYNVYFCVRNNLKLSIVTTNSSSSFDLMWNRTHLKRIDPFCQIKFELNVSVVPFIFEQVLNNLNDAIYFDSQNYNVSFSFWDNYYPTQMFNVYVWSG